MEKYTINECIEIMLYCSNKINICSQCRNFSDKDICSDEVYRDIIYYLGKIKEHDVFSGKRYKITYIVNNRTEKPYRAGIQKQLINKDVIIDLLEENLRMGFVVGDTGKTVMTSKVKDIDAKENRIMVITENSTYLLIPQEEIK